MAGSAITVAYTLTDSPVAWFVLTFLHGVVGGVPWVVSEIWMNVVVEEKRRGRVMGIYASWWRSAWRWVRSCCRSSASTARRRS